MPVSTGTSAAADSFAEAGVCGCSIAAAATVPIRPISGLTVPLPSGCRRLLRKITIRSQCGSIQSAVPVNPPCPKARGESRSPRLDE